MSRYPRRHLLMDRILGVLILSGLTGAISYPLLNHYLN